VGRQVALVAVILRLRLVATSLIATVVTATAALVIPAVVIVST
jgi:hypothetical protein